MEVDGGGGGAPGGGTPREGEPALEAFLAAAVHESLAAYLPHNAAFLAERLVAAAPTPANTLLLATCYYRGGNTFRAYATLKGSRAPECRYLQALCALELDKLPEAEQALAPKGEGGEVPNGAAGHYLYGLVCKRTDRRQLAITHLTAALTLDPFMWSAYEELCNLGAEEEVDNLVSAASPDCIGAAANALSPSPLFAAGGGAALAAETPGTAFAVPMAVTTPGVANDMAMSVDRSAVTPTPMATLGAPPSSSRGVRPASAFRGDEATAPTPVGGDIAMAGTPASASFVTPTFVTPAGVAPGAGAGGPPPPQKQAPGGAGRDDPAATSTSGAAPAGGPRRKVVEPDGKMRKVSSRLFSDSGAPLQSLRRSSRLSMAAAAASAATAAAEASMPRDKATPRRGSGGAGTSNGVGLFGRATEVSAARGWGRRTAEGAAAAWPLLRVLAMGYKQLCMYQCQGAVQTLQELPPEQYSTAWVLCQVGRAYAEMVDYLKAEHAFEWARRLCPHRLEGMEVYSTVLWHLKKEVELSYLAQEAVALDRLSPHAWCILGNCFSLQKEHETALKFFQRALQLDSRFSYAHTLCGHEYFANEDFEKSVACYRAALQIDPRHYNAWYGLGTVYLRQEKYELSEYHFRRALAVNTRSSVLYCCLGMALHALKRNREALVYLETAINTDARNPLAKYEKARVLMSEERFPEALSELEALKDIAPREASVFFLMGRLYKKLNQPNQAIVHFSVALDLKPSSSDVNLIKSAIEKLHDEEDGDELW